MGSMEPNRYQTIIRDTRIRYQFDGGKRVEWLMAKYNMTREEIIASLKHGLEMQRRTRNVAWEPEETEE